MTLIELLAVMAVMSIIMTLVAGSYQSFAGNVELANSLQQMTGTLDLARQLATSRNEYVQVRFYSPKGGSTNADNRVGEYTGMGLFKASSPLYASNAADYADWVGKGILKQEGKMVTLPASCILVSNDLYSPLLKKLREDTVRKGSVTLPDGREYDFVSFYYKPDGSMDVKSTNTNDFLSVSLAHWGRYMGNGKKLPPNYGVITLDNVNGRYHVVRP